MLIMENGKTGEMVIGLSHGDLIGKVQIGDRSVARTGNGARSLG